MAESTSEPAATEGPAPVAGSAGADVPDEVLDEVLVEEVSIDGMCGVY